MHRALREAKIDRATGNFAIFDSETSKSAAVGRVVAVGLSDEINDRHFVVVDGIDGKVHYADIERIRPVALPGHGTIVSLEAAEQEAGNRQKTRMRILFYLNLEKLVATEGAIWLDGELASKTPRHIGDQGFGTDLKSALRNRLQWLTERDMIEPTPEGGVRRAAAAMRALTRNEIDQAVATHSAASVLEAAQLMGGERFEGIYTRPISLASGICYLRRRQRQVCHEKSQRIDNCLGVAWAQKRPGQMRQKIDRMNTALGVGGHFLLGPLRRAATAQALSAQSACPSPQPRSPSPCYGLRCGPPPSTGLSVALAAHPALSVQLC